MRRSTRKSQPDDRSGARPHLAGAALIAVLSLAVYWPSLGGGFILDDQIYLTENTIIKSPEGLYKFWLTTSAVDYYPVSNSTLWLEWRLWGPDPTGYRVTNLALHVASALLFWFVLSRLSVRGAFLAALLFAVHSVNVESVAWIAQRKDVLAVFFSVLCAALYFYSGSSVPPKPRYWASLLCFCAAMLSKGSVAVVPVLMILCIWWLNGRISTADAGRMAPFFFVAAALTLVNVSYETHGMSAMVRQISHLDRMLGAAAAVWFYLGKAVLPVRLMFVYPQWTINSLDWRWWIPLAAFAAATIILIAYRRIKSVSVLLFAWSFYLIALAPVLGFIDVGYMQFTLVADHYQHLAIIAPCALAAAGLVSLKPKLVALAVSGVVVAALCILANCQAQLYEGAVKLYSAALQSNPDSPMLQNTLGNALDHLGKAAEAIPYYRNATRLKPDYIEAWYNLAVALGRTGQTDEAIRCFRIPLEATPSGARVHLELANTLLLGDRLAEAVEEFDNSIALAPNNPIAYNNRGAALFKLKRYDHAIASYNRSLEMDQDNPATYSNLVEAYEAAGRMHDAVAAAKKQLETARKRGNAAKAREAEDWLQRNVR
jgi:tetratricopeptide (TPR) repeat protein